MANRQQRRQQAREQAAYSKLMNSAMNKRRTQRENEVSVELYFTALGLALHDLYGFGALRISRVWQKADDYMTCLANKTMTYPEMKQKLIDEANIECSFE